MSESHLHNKLEKKEGVEDNARKFLLDTLDSKFLKDQNATSFTLIVDWLETNEDNEKKLAYKIFDNGEIQILLITKTTKDGNRTSEKIKINIDEYNQLKKSSVLHLEKKRYEFKLMQGDTSFTLKYDEFEGGKLNMLEVDASTEDERNLFNPIDFITELSEVTGDNRYTGYRVSQMV